MYVSRQVICPVAGALVCALALVSCGMPMGPRGAGGPGGAMTTAALIPDVVVPVEASKPTRGNIATYFETTTRVEAERLVNVAAKASARCIAVLAEVGDAVKVGEIIAELERDEAQALYQQSDVQVRQNKTSFELAQRQYEEGLGPKVEMDNARYAYDQSLATLETQKLQLENLTIRAPIDGVITSRTIQEGMLVSTGMEVFRIVDPTSFILTISPPERELPRLEVGQKAKVTIDAMRGKEFEATIRRINPSVDPVSGTVKVVLDFDEDMRKSLRESSFARVKLVMATLQNVLLAPKEALIEEEGRQYVFVVRPAPEAADGPKPESAPAPADGAATDENAIPLVAERVEVRAGLEDTNRVQILSGVTEDDLLITNGQYTLKPGAKVRVTNLHDEVWQNAKLTADEALEVAEKRRVTSAASAQTPTR